MTAASDMEVDITLGGLRVFQYLESGDPYYLLAYQQHSDRFRQHIERRLVLAPLGKWQHAARDVATLYAQLNRFSRDAMLNYFRMHRMYVCFTSTCRG